MQLSMTMRKLFQRTFASLSLAAALILAGCGEGVDIVHEADESSFRRGQSYLGENRPNEALNAFLAVIEGRDDAPESHLAAGQIYLTHIQDPIASIYHFRRFLELKPDTARSDQVRALIETARREFAAMLPGQPFANDLDRLGLLEQVEDLRDTNTELRRRNVELERERETLRTEVATLGAALRQTQSQLRRVQNAPGLTTSESTPIVIAEPSSAGNEAETRPAFYTVQGGDTLTSISTRVYGTSGRWMDIYQANRDQIGENPNNLRVGMELRLP